MGLAVLRTIPIHRFGVRPNLFLGGDRELVMFSGLLSFALVFSAMDLFAAIFGIALWVVSLFLFRWMGKADPLMRFVYLRHTKYAKYYPARSTPWRENKRVYR